MPFLFQFEPATVLTRGVRTLDLRYRPCQKAFLENLWHQKYSNLRARLSDMTSFSLKFSESPQILYYVPGAFYRVHSDHLFIVSSALLIAVYCP